MRTQTEIRKQYGGTWRQAINRAIRAEMPGGNELLDAMKSLDDLMTMTRQGATACSRTYKQACVVMDKLRLCREIMESEILEDEA